MFTLFVASALALAAIQVDGSPAATATAAAQSQSRSSDDIVVTGERPKDKRVTCRTENKTGSLFAKRICRTAAQVEEQRAQSVKFMEEASRLQTLGTTTDMRERGPK